MVTVAELSAKLNVKDGGSSKRLKAFNLTITDLKAGLELAAGAARIAANAVRAFTTDLAKQGDQVAKTARNLGIGVQAVQELDFAAKIAGVGINEVRTAIQRMQKGLNDARVRGTGPFADGLEQLGLKIEDFEGLEPDVLFEKLSESLSKLEDDTTRAALAQDFFGRGGKTLLPLINEGATGIQALRKEFQSLEGGFSDAGAANAEEFQDSMLRLETVIQGIKIAIGEELFPVIIETIDGVRDWVSANRDVIKLRLREFINKVTAAARRLGPSLIAIGEALEVIIPFFIDLIADTHELFTNLEALDEQLTNDFGPAWEIAKQALDNIVLPFEIVIGFITSIPKIIEAAVDKLKEFGGTFERIAQIIEDNTPDILKSEVRATSRNVKPLGGVHENAPGGSLIRDGGSNLSSDQLTKIAANDNLTIEKRAAAQAFIPFARGREAVEARNERERERAQTILALGEVGVLGIDAASNRALQKQRKKDRKKKGRRGKGGGGAKSKRESDFDDLFSAESLQRRVAEGDVTPTILITVTNFNINQTIDAPVNVTGLSSTTAQEVVAMIQRQFDEMLEGSVRRGVQDVESRVAR